ncbi:hypothetical protein ACNKHO_17830 [Shigella flexneri]
MPRPLNNTDTDRPPTTCRAAGRIWLPGAGLRPQIIRAQIAKLISLTLSVSPKGCSNIQIRADAQQGVKVDSVSLGEIERASAAGDVARKDEIVFTADMIDEAQPFPSA